MSNRLYDANYHAKKDAAAAAARNLRDAKYSFQPDLSGSRRRRTQPPPLRAPSTRQAAARTRVATTVRTPLTQPQRTDTHVGHHQEAGDSPTQATETTPALAAENALLRAELAKTAALLEHAQAEALDVEATLQAASRHIDTYEEALRQRDNTIAALNDELATAVARADEDRTQWVEHEAAFEAAAANRLEKVISITMVDKLAHESSVHALRTTIAALNDELATTAAQMKEAQTQAVDVQAALEAAACDRVDLVAKLRYAMEALAELMMWTSETTSMLANNGEFDDCDEIVSSVDNWAADEGAQDATDAAEDDDIPLLADNHKFDDCDELASSADNWAADEGEPQQVADAIAAGSFNVAPIMKDAHLYDGCGELASSALAQEDDANQGVATVPAWDSACASSPIDSTRRHSPPAGLLTPTLPVAAKPIPPTQESPAGPHKQVKPRKTWAHQGHGIYLPAA